MSLPEVAMNKPVKCFCSVNRRQGDQSPQNGSGDVDGATDGNGGDVGDQSGETFGCLLLECHDE